MISVIMPVFNEEELDLKESIDSILNQTMKEIELIIILDNPLNKVIDKFILNYIKTDKRIVYLKNEKNIGIGLTLNRGIENSKYDLIARLDADDLSSMNRLKVQYDYLSANPNIDMVSTNCINIDEDGIELSKKSSIPEQTESIRKLLPFGSTIIHSSVMYRKNVVENLNGYRQLLNCQDYDLWLRMIDNGYNIASINEYLTFYRIREQSITISQSLRSFLTEEYVRNLHNQRSLNGKDDFSFDSYIQYLNKNGIENDDRKKKFSKAIKIYNQAIEEIYQKKYFKGIKLLVESIILDQLMLKKIKNMIVYKYKRKGLV